jgi:predicted nucleic acid-binding Zn ribbon protein
MPWSPLPDPDGEGPAPAALPDVLDRVLAGLGAPSVDAVVALHERWPDVVGEELAGHAKPVAIERGKLSITVDNPAWANHLRWSEAEVLERCARVLGAGVVTSISTRVGRR